MQSLRRIGTWLVALFCGALAATGTAFWLDYTSTSPPVPGVVALAVGGFVVASVVTAVERLSPPNPR